MNYDIPSTYPYMPKVRIEIPKWTEWTDTFWGQVIGETTTHYLVTHETNRLGEWFPKQAKSIVVTIEQ